MERDIGSIVNEVIRTISSQAFYFSFRKNFEKAKINKQNKNKQTLNNKGNTKTSKRAKVVCFAFWCFFYAQNFFVKKKKNWLEIVLTTSFTILLKCIYFALSAHPCIFLLDKNSFSEKFRDLWHAMPRHWWLCFLVSPWYLQDAMSCQWSSSNLPRVLWIWESVFHSQAGFRADSSTSKLAGLHADHRNIVPGLFVWITAIHNKNMPVGSI